MSAQTGPCQITVAVLAQVLHLYENFTYAVHPPMIHDYQLSTVMFEVKPGDQGLPARPTAAAVPPCSRGALGAGRGVQVPPRPQPSRDLPSGLTTHTVCPQRTHGRSVWPLVALVRIRREVACVTCGPEDNVLQRARAHQPCLTLSEDETCLLHKILAQTLCCHAQGRPAHDVHGGNDTYACSETVLQLRKGIVDASRMAWRPYDCPPLAAPPQPEVARLLAGRRAQFMQHLGFMVRFPP